MSHRAQPQNMEYAAPLKFNTPLRYHTDHPKEWLDEEGYWNSINHMVQKGDEITAACIHDDGTWDKAMFEVISATQRAVICERIGEWRYGGTEIIRGLKAVHAGRGTWKVVDDAGHVVAKNLTKAEALNFVNARAPETEAAEQAA